MSSPSSPSSPSPPQPTEPPPQRTDYRGGGTRGQSSNLYLVTFLATLFLLLFVSCGIVLRSYILRRRYQRRLEEAMATGLLLTPRSPGSRRTRFGAKPRVFDSWIADGGEKWTEMNPVAAQPVFVMRKCKGSFRSSTLEAEQPAIQSTISADGGPAAYLGVRSFWQRIRTSPPMENNETDDSDQPIPVTPTSAQSPSSPASAFKYRAEMLQVSVLIAMPSNDRSQRKNLPPELKKLANDEDEDEPLPELALGVTRVLYRHPKSSRQTLQSTPPSPVGLSS